MVFVLLGVLVHIVYTQMNTTLPVYLRDEHGLPPEGFGIILTINAGMVVLLQISVTRWLRERGYAPLMVMVAGTLLYAVGFAMYGFVSLYVLFVAAMVIITVGEMVIAPVGQALAAGFAREDMRGRYMAIFGFGFGLASGIGTYLAGIVIESIGPDWVWYLGGIGGLLAALGYWLLHRYMIATEREITATTTAAASAEPVT
jgi:MFS family permease